MTTGAGPEGTGFVALSTAPHRISTASPWVRKLAGADSSRRTSCLVAVGSDLIEQLGFHPAPEVGDAAD